MEMNISQQVEYSKMQAHEGKLIAAVIFAAPNEEAEIDELTDHRVAMQNFLEDNNISEV